MSSSSLSLLYFSSSSINIYNLAPAAVKAEVGIETILLFLATRPAPHWLAEWPGLSVCPVVLQLPNYPKLPATTRVLKVAARQSGVPQSDAVATARVT